MDMKKLLTIVSGQEKKQINESVAEAGCGMHLVCRPVKCPRMRIVERWRSIIRLRSREL
jgi:hypothetical protein